MSRGNLLLEIKKGESITIGDDIVIQCLKGTRSGKVRLSIRAPRDMPIKRIKPEGSSSGEKLS